MNSKRRNGEKIGKKRYYVTYFDRNYLVKGLALIESLNELAGDFQLFVVCMDEISRLVIDKLNLPNIRTVPVHEIEKRDSPLLNSKKNRSMVEYYWTMTPTIILRLLESNPEVEILTYLDSDLYFYSSPEPIFDELGGSSVLIHEHRFPPNLKRLEIHGKYNVGLLCFRNDKWSRVVLNWWREKCIEWCYSYVSGDGKFADQKYLDDWTTRFEKVAVLKNVGAGVAPWNHEQYAYGLEKNRNVLVDGNRLIFYHFHALAFVNPSIIVPAKIVDYSLKKDVLKYCFLPYFHALSKAIVSAQSILPEFYFGLFQENLLNEMHTFAARRELETDLRESGVPYPAFHLDEKWDCYCSPQTK